MKTRRHKDLSPEEIQFMLKRTEDGTGGYWTFAKVDRYFNLKLGAARKAAHSALFAGEAAIAKALHLLPRQIWPSRYGKDDVRLKPQPSENYQNYNAIPHIRKCQKRKAA